MIRFQTHYVTDGGTKALQEAKYAIRLAAMYGSAAQRVVA